MSQINNEEQKATTPTSTPIPTPEVVIPVLNPDEILDVDYVDMWENYSDNLYNGKWVRVIGKLEKMEYMKNVYFKEDIPEGLTNSLSITASDESEYDNFSNGDYVTIVGLVENKNFGTLTINYATIESASDEDLAARLKYSEDRSAKKTQEIKDYKNSAETVSYDSLIREPSKYEGKILKITIKVSQVMTGGLITEAGYSGKASGNEWYIHYDIPDDVARIIKDDTVTFYGEFAGLSKMTRAITGVAEYVPKLNAKYHVIN